MMIVGASLARAFGIVGAANLIRYRAKIDDPKDAVVMLATLSIGLACGVELYGLAVFATLFILGVLWVVESLEPELRKMFDLKVTAADPTAHARRRSRRSCAATTSTTSCAAPATRSSSTRPTCRSMRAPIGWPTPSCSCRRTARPRSPGKRRRKNRAQGTRATVSAVSRSTVAVSGLRVAGIRGPDDRRPKIETSSLRLEPCALHC